MNEQQLQQILTIQQAIAAAATAAVINSLLNPQQAANNGLQNANINALTEALQNTQNQLDLQQQPDSRQDSPVAASSSPAASILSNDASRIQELLLQLQQQAANNGANAANNNTMPQHHPQQQQQQQQQQQHQQQQAALLAALNLNLGNANNLPLQQQLQANLNGNPLSQSSIASRLQLDQTELNLAAATGSNISNQTSPNKKLKNRHIQPPVVPSYTPQSRSSLETTIKPQQNQSTPKNQHSTLANLSNRNNTSSNSGSSSSFLPNNVGLPRKLVRGQDVWLGRGAEQTRQILKCMWCGQSFRTLAEMTQHMRETQHYTNIISQEQITSWRQPDGSESSSLKHNKQSNHSSRTTEDLLDDTSERFNDSEDNFSNDDEASPRQRVKPKSTTKSNSSKKDSFQTEVASSESAFLNQCSTTNSFSKSPSKNCRKRENEESTKPLMKREKLDSVASPSSTSSSQQRVLNDLNGNSETSKDVKSDSDERESSVSNRAVSNLEDREQTESPSIKSENNKTDDNLLDDEQKTKIRPDSHASDREDDVENNTGDVDLNDSHGELDDRTRGECEENSKDFDQPVDDENNSDSKTKNHRPNKKHSEIDIATSTKQTIVDGQKLDASGDPLSALETMVEKSFDPRMRPGIASGGILQRLGIDEEVCPPWQHINYANWYAAAAYGHPMAAALLAAGINLQNGIKLGKNVSSKKNEDD